jgi:hypothetical protein
MPACSGGNNGGYIEWYHKSGFYWLFSRPSTDQSSAISSLCVQSLLFQLALGIPITTGSFGRDHFREWSVHRLTPYIVTSSRQLITSSAIEALLESPRTVSTTSAMSPGAII